MERLASIMQKSLLVLFGLAFVFMLLQPFSDVGFVEPLSVMILAVGLFFGLRWLYRKLEDSSVSRLKKVFIGLFLAFVILQVLVINLSHAGVFGDPWHIQAQATRLIEGGRSWDIWIQMYPNLVPLVALYMLFIKMAGLTHLSYYAIFYTFNILINSSLWLLVMRIIWKKKASLAVFMMALLLTMAPMYGFLLNVAYSDGIAMLSLAVMAWILDRSLGRGRLSLAGFIGTAFAFAFAYLTRPNAVVIMVALAIIGLLAWKKQGKYQPLVKISFLMILGSVLGIVLAVLANQGIASAVGYDLNNPHVFPIWNWLYEGLNLRSGGEWTPTDRDYTLYHPGFATAKEADIAGIVQRLKDYNILIIPLFVVKFATLWSSGTFATGTDYTLFSASYNWTHGPAFLIQNIGAINIFWMTYAKALMAVLLLAIVLTLWKKREDVVSLYGFLLLSIMGISLFHSLLWEVKPRYQFMTFGLLLIAVAMSLPNLFGLNEAVFEPNKKKLALPWIMAGLSLLSVILMATVMQVQPKQKIVVNSQQHSTESYGYELYDYWMKPGESLTQAFKLPVPADQIIWETASTGKLKLEIQKQTAEGWQTVDKQELPRLDIPAEDISLPIITDLEAGNYRFKLSNPNPTKTSVRLLNNTQTLDYPQLIRLPNQETASLGFIIGQDQAVSKYPVGLIIAFALLFILTILALIFLI
ncbi:glycosyltransferase family protein [Lactococcus termiticola]